MQMNPAFFKLQPQYRNYVWGGNRLKADSQPVAEAWLVYAGNLIQGGPFHGQTLAQAAAALGEDLLGAGRGGDFPLLIKIIDSAEWLSLQVHPDDEQAQRLEGPGFCGKTEAWHILEAAEGAELIAGFNPGITPAHIQAAVGQAAILNLVQRRPVQSGDTVFMPPGTIHAIGPGLLVYEVQQSSDITYRIYDWERPQVNGRRLHIEKSAAVLNPQSACQFIPAAGAPPEGPLPLARSTYFSLDLLTIAAPLQMDTRHATFHALTIIQGALDLQVGGELTHLEPFETVLLPAACGAYSLLPAPGARALLAALPAPA